MSPNIHKIQAVTDFTILHNKTARDVRLSFRARGILIMMLTLPPDWKSHATWIEEQGTEGREALRTCFRELERFGYLKRTKIRDGRKFAGTHWEWRYEPQAGFSCDGFPSVDKSPTTKKGSDKGNRTQKKEKGGFVPKHTFKSLSKAFKPRFPYPNTEDEMYDFLDSRGVESTPDYDASFFRDATRWGWKDPRTGDPIYDWVAFYEGRTDVTFPGKSVVPLTIATSSGPF